MRSPVIISRYQHGAVLGNETALRMIKLPEFWCRAKLFHALAAAKKSGVLEEVLGEMELPEDAIEQIERHLDVHWNDTVVRVGFAGAASAKG